MALLKSNSRVRAELRLFWLMCLMCLVPVCALKAAPATTEYDVKAVFLLNFTRFVEWPEDETNPNRPLVIGILGDDPFGESLDRVVSGEKVGDRTIVIKRLKTYDGSEQVDTLFIAKSEKSRLKRILESLRKAPVLTVSDLPNFAEAGGIIGLVTENSKVRLHINVDVSREANLNLSSKLLRPALIVSSRRRSELRPGVFEMRVRGLAQHRLAYSPTRYDVRPQ